MYILVSMKKIGSMYLFYLFRIYPNVQSCNPILLKLFCYIISYVLMYYHIIKELDMMAMLHV